MNKLQHLKQLLNEMASAVLAFSGGVDSTFLLKIAHEILGERLLAVTAISPIYPEWEIKQAKSIASELGIRHLLVENEALANKKFIRNPPQRCYWCKIDLYGRLKRLALEHQCAFIMDGTNADDHTDYRPGMQATQELGIRSPLQESGIAKAEIRQLSREIGLQTWDKPSCACLASRFPYGQAINEKLLRMVGKAEDYLRDLDFTQVRVRHLGDTAKIELLPEDIARAQNDNNRIKIVKYLKDLGYTYITLDLEGYRTGSMNEVLKDKNTGDRIQKPE